MTAASGYYRCSVRPIGRSTGGSATAAAAYRAGERIHDDRTGLTHDYQRRTGIERTEFFTPEAGQWIQDRTQLWNAAEQAERKSNARVAREAIVCFPHQLSAEERYMSGHSLAKWMTEQYGVAVDVAWHYPDKHGDQRNYHAHLLFTTREVTAEGLGKKTRVLDSVKTGPEEVHKIREQWATILNQSLARCGSDVRVDHRSYQDQGLDIKPGIHLGRTATTLERNGVQTTLGDVNRAVQADNDNIQQWQQELDVLQKELAEVQKKQRIQRIDPPAAAASVMTKEPVDRTYIAVSRQLKGMGADRYDIGVLLPPNKDGDRKMLRRFWTAEQLSERAPETGQRKKLAWLKSQNRKGADIYVRPDPRAGNNHGLILIDDLEGFKWEAQLERDGLKPAVVTQTSDGNRQAWIRVSDRSLDSATATQTAKLLAARYRDYGADPASADWMHYGRLAGFTNQKGEHVRKDGRQPFVLLEKYNGKTAAQGAQLLQEARLQVEATKLAQTSLSSAEAIVVPENTPSEKAISLRDWYERNWDKFRASLGDDDSRVDFHMCQAAMRRGHSDNTVAWALRYGSHDLETRKAGHVNDYVDRTVRKARAWLEVQREQGRDTSHPAAAQSVEKGQGKPAEKDVNERSQAPQDQADQRLLIEQWQQLRDDRERSRGREQAPEPPMFRPEKAPLEQQPIDPNRTRMVRSVNVLYTYQSEGQGTSQSKPDHEPDRER
ncbi:MAG: MobQ family relaxase [Cyanobacteria bacterium P01_C01_bin.120]